MKRWGEAVGTLGNHKLTPGYLNYTQALSLQKFYMCAFLHEILLSGQLVNASHVNKEISSTCIKS